jgi:O-antigen/teichoic acid export membrane protein
LHGTHQLTGIFEHLKSERLASAGRKLASFTSLSGLSQLLQLAGALIVVRTLSKEDYGFYSLANNLLGALAMFTTTGLSTGLMAVAGPVANSPARLAAVLSSAARLRLQLLSIGSLVGVPVYFWLLLHNGCSLWTTLVLLSVAVVTILFYIRSHVLGAALNLRRFYSVVQKEKVANSAIRMLLLAVVLSFGLQGSVSYMLVGFLATVVSLRVYLVRASRGLVESGVPADADASASLHKHMVVGMPSSLTYLFEGQIAALLLAAFGNVDKVADLGAIARFGLIFIVPLAMLRDVLIPRMATQENLAQLRKMWIGSSLLTAAACLSILTFFFFLAGPLLNLLGPGYSHLKSEMLLYVGFQVFVFFTMVAGSPIISRGWVRHSWIRPVFFLAAQAVAIPFLDLSTVTGAILLMWAGALGNVALDTFLLYRGWRGKGHV